MVGRETLLGHVWGYNLLHYRDQSEVSALWFSYPCPTSWNITQGSAPITPERSLHTHAYHRVKTKEVGDSQLQWNVTGHCRMEPWHCSKVGGTRQLHAKLNKPDTGRWAQHVFFFSFISWDSKTISMNMKQWFLEFGYWEGEGDKVGHIRLVKFVSEPC